MKTVDFIKRNIVGFILGAVLFGSIGAYAASVASKDVTYSNTNVEAAINDLYSKVGKGGTVKVVTLGTATSYNIKNLYPQVWNKVTVNNFYYRISAVNTAKKNINPANQVQGRFVAPSISYNTSTGVLTCGNGTIYAQVWDDETSYDGNVYDRGTYSGTATTTCYMVYLEE